MTGLNRSSYFQPSSNCDLWAPILGARFDVAGDVSQKGRTTALSKLLKNHETSRLSSLIVSPIGCNELRNLIQAYDISSPSALGIMSQCFHSATTYI